jgi:hypothetical protein
MNGRAMPPSRRNTETKDLREANRLGFIGISTLFTLSILCLSLGALV